MVVQFEGKDESAEEVAFEPEKEGWASYKLQDGNVLRLRHVVANIFRLKDRKREDGSPIYVIQGATIANTIQPTRELAAKD